MVMSAKGLRKRNHVWRHNTARGNLRHAIVNLSGMKNLSSLTQESQLLLSQTLTLLERFRTSLETRHDPEDF